MSIRVRLLLLCLYLIFYRSVALSASPSSFNVNICPGGALEVTIGNDQYYLESSYSYPGLKIAYNNFATVLSRQKLKVRYQEKKSIWYIETSCPYYSLRRKISVEERRIKIKDTFRNIRNKPVGIILHYKVSTAEKYREELFSGYQDEAYTSPAPNPTVFVKHDMSSLGIVAADALSRLKLSAKKINDSVAGFSINKFILDAGKEYTFEWHLYPGSGEEEYFAFINKVREDWQVNFTINGPFDFFDVLAKKELVGNKEDLKNYFQRKKVGIIALIPWLDYDNFNYVSGKPLSRAEYKKLMQNAYAAIKSATPETKIIGCMQSNLFPLPENVVQRIYQGLSKEKKEAGMYATTPREKEIIEKADLVCKDSLLVGRDGNYRYELYYPMKDPVTGELPHNSIPFIAVNVYTTRGNYQFHYWLEQARFLLEEVGLDGLYIDQFSLAFNEQQRYTFSNWDGVTGDINKKTGKIDALYTDCSYTGIETRKAFIQYVLSKNKTMVANTYATVPQVQSFPVFRFGEGGEWGFDPLVYTGGKEIPFWGYYTKGHLGSPIILGGRPWSQFGQKGIDNYVEVIMRSIIVYLRHGLLYYYFNTEIPESGPGSGEHGPINHMFPITPVSLGEGFVEGKERIITAVSGDFLWKEERKPFVFLFDVEGRFKKPNYELQKNQAGWKVTLNLNDWEEIAIVE